MERRAHEGGTTRVIFAADLEDNIDEFGVVGPDGVRLLVMGKVGQGGAGSMCGAHATPREFGVTDVVVVANKVRDAADRSAIADFCRAHDMNLVGEVPYDGGLAEAERRGGAPIDVAPEYSRPGTLRLIPRADRPGGPPRNRARA